MSLTPAIVVDDDDGAAAPSGGAPSGRAAAVGRAASWEGSVDELPQIMKPYVTHAVCMPAVTPVCVGQSIEKIGQKQQLLTAIRERVPNWSLKLVDLTAAFLQIYEERTSAGQDMGLIPTDVEESSERTSWQTEQATKLKVMLVHLNRNYNAKPPPRWYRLIFPQQGEPAAAETRPSAANADAAPKAAAWSGGPESVPASWSQRWGSQDSDPTPVP